MDSVVGAGDGGFVAVLDALDAAMGATAAIDVAALTHADILTLLERLEVVARRLPVPGHRAINRLAAEANPIQLGATSLTNLLAERMRISRTDARRRIDSAKDLAPRTALSGETLPPLLAETADAQARGQIGAEHVAVIRNFFARLPEAVDFQTRESAEATLARVSKTLTPEELRQAAERLMAYLHPDGDFTDTERGRRRFLTIGDQRADGMSQINGLLSPEARATLDAVLATWAAPGMCNPDDEVPVVDGEADAAAVQGDQRSPGQRNHDALIAMGRAVLASGELGSHNGLPATIVVTTSLAELESGLGYGHTGGGTLLPMSDVIRLASHAHQYLAVFDKGTEVALNLYRSKRIASIGQRLVLQAKYRGCTYPGCTVPGYRCQVHHAKRDWGQGGLTNVNDLTLGCGPHNRVVNTDGWSTRQLPDGRTQWIRPPHLDNGGPRVNGYHHPERMLADPGDQDDESESPG
jgi:Domain of unknown function (DUF222)